MQPTFASSSAIAERPRCRVGQFWPNVEDDILQTLQVSFQSSRSFKVTNRKPVCDFLSVN